MKPDTTSSNTAAQSHKTDDKTDNGTKNTEAAAVSKKNDPQNKPAVPGDTKEMDNKNKPIVQSGDREIGHKTM